MPKLAERTCRGDLVVALDVQWSGRPCPPVQWSGRPPRVLFPLAKSRCHTTPVPHRCQFHRLETGATHRRPVQNQEIRGGCAFLSCAVAIGRRCVDGWSKRARMRPLSETWAPARRAKTECVGASPRSTRHTVVRSVVESRGERFPPRARCILTARRVPAPLRCEHGLWS